MKRILSLGTALFILSFFVGVIYAQTVPSMLYIGTLDESSPTLEGSEFYSVYSYTAEPGEVVVAYLHSQDFDAFLGLLAPDGSLVAVNDDGAGTGLDAWIVAELEGGEYRLVVTTVTAGESGAYQLFVASGVTRTGQFEGKLEPGVLTLYDGTPAALYLFEGEAGERVSLSVDSSDFDAVLMVAAPDGSYEVDDDSEGSNPRLDYVLPAAGLYPVFVKSYAAGGYGSYGLTIRSGVQDTISASKTVTPQPAGGVVPLVGNTWVYQTMTFSGTNEFIRGHLTLYPAGRYEMQVRIGEFVNRYQGAYRVAGDQLTLEGYGTTRFAQSGVRLTLWDSAGSIYGLALEGACENGVCAQR